MSRLVYRPCVPRDFNIQNSPNERHFITIVFIRLKSIELTTSNAFLLFLGRELVVPFPAKDTAFARTWPILVQYVADHLYLEIIPSRALIMSAH